MIEDIRLLLASVSQSALPPSLPPSSFKAAQIHTPHLSITAMAPYQSGHSASRTGQYWAEEIFLANESAILVLENHVLTSSTT